MKFKLVCLLLFTLDKGNYEKKINTMLLRIQGLETETRHVHVHFLKMVMSNFLEIDFAIKVNDNNHCSLALSLSEVILMCK